MFRSVGSLNATHLTKHFTSCKGVWKRLRDKRDVYAEEKRLFEPLKRQREKFPPDDNKTELIIEEIVKFTMDDQHFFTVESVVLQLSVERLKPRCTAPSQQEKRLPHSCSFSIADSFQNTLKILNINIWHLDLRHASCDIRMSDSLCIVKGKHV